jgi:hypothetical protein
VCVAESCTWVIMLPGDPNQESPELASMACWICTLCRVYLAPVVTRTIRTGICKEALIRKIQKSESFGRGSTKKAAPLGVPE